MIPVDDSSDTERPRTRRPPSAARRRRQRARLALAFRMLRLASLTVRWLPIRVASALGAALGAVASIVAIGPRRRAQKHLMLALGDETTPPERARIVRRLFRHTGRSVFEFLVDTRLGREHALASVVEVEGREHLDAALARGNGVIGTSLHFGLWELGAIWLMSQSPGPGRVIGARMRHAASDELLREIRRRMGVEMVYPNNVRELLRTLRGGGIVGVLCDHDSDKHAGAFLPFFRRMAYTLTGPATLAHRSGAAIVPMTCLRLGPTTHRVWVLPEIDVDRSLLAAEWVLEATRRISESFETFIRARPEQWQWFHKRWDTTPEKLERHRRRRASVQAARTEERESGRRNEPAVR